ncbi:MAG: right-handed parallel beta-helix repeat-containing protein, partial [Candidatus Cloacimonetes bacterium]|nr:right-handed parallel beta-helix repeat-containing protein [Candidatus Cloacimonadota bacterium]
MKTINVRHFTPALNNMPRVSLLIILLMLLIPGTYLFGNTQNSGFPFNDGDQPKSYDYIITPGSTLTINGVLDAIQTRYNNNEKNIFRVGLGTGIHADSVYWIFQDNSTVFNDIYIELAGLGVNTQIRGDNFLMSNSGNLHFTFNNLLISGGVRGIESVVNPNNGALTFLEVKKCKIYDNEATGYGQGVNMNGTGIYAEGPVLISECEIYDNHGMAHWASYNGVENFSMGGGIALVNNSNYEAIIEYSRIYNNSAIAGGGIYATGTGQITMRYNKVYSNTRSYYGDPSSSARLQGGAGEGIWAFECQKLNLAFNLIYDQIAGSVPLRAPLPLSSAVVVEYCGYNPSLTTVKIDNNSFMDNVGCHGIWITDPLGGTRLRNNLSRGNMFGIYCRYYANGIINVSYNNSFGNGTLNGEVQNYRFDYPPWIVQLNNGEFDPQVDSNYAPLWNESVISPLIDSGCPYVLDPDGTPSDIGALRTGDHKYEEYTMPGPSAIKWMSFPVLNRTTDGYCMNGNFFDPILDDRWLEVIKYKPKDSPEKEIKLVDDEWENLPDTVSSLQGYKIMMTPNAPTDLKIITSGHLQAPHTVVPLNQGENWLGYFQETSSKPLDALAPILNYIDLIQTQNWTMVKIPGFGWIHNNNWVINYGDMVIVNALQACSFSWNNSQPVDPKSVAKATAFEYAEKMDYTPFYITIPDAKSVDMPTEIGLYVNGVCKGASVVEDGLTHICAYLEDGEEITPENADLVFFYSSKSVPQNKSIYKLSDGHLQHNREGFTYYSIEIKDMGHVVPAPQEVMLS